MRRKKSEQMQGSRVESGVVDNRKQSKGERGK